MSGKEMFPHLKSETTRGQVGTGKALVSWNNTNASCLDGNGKGTGK